MSSDMPETENQEVVEQEVVQEPKKKPMSFSKKMQILLGALLLSGIGGGENTYKYMEGIHIPSATAGKNKYNKKPEPLTDEDIRRNAEVDAKKAAKKARQEARRAAEGGK